MGIKISKKSIFLHFLYVMILIIFLKSAFSATISGSIYNWELDKEERAVVEVNSIPIQRMVTINGTYHFELKKGNYLVSAVLFNQEEYRTQENITILDDDGNYNLDLFLFYELDDYVEDIDLDLVEDEPSYSIYYILTITILIIALIAVIFFLQKRKNNIKTEPEIKNNNLDDKIKFDIIKILKEKGGAETQKNVRKHFDYSEAKISLMIKALEEEGKVEKEKRGTINYIKLK
jgi:uncharacterized membrane protein